MHLTSFSRAALVCAVAGFTGGLAAPSTATDLRGFASAGPLGVLLFQPCDGKKISARLLKVEDGTPDSALTSGIDEVRKIMLDSGRPVYVEFRGDKTGTAVTARQFRRALGTVEVCGAFDLGAGSRLLALGSDPPWRFELTAAGGRLERPGLKPVRFPVGAFAQPQKDGTTRVFDAWSPQDGGTIRLEVNEELCSDGRSESAYGARATLRYGSQSYAGCAALY